MIPGESNENRRDPYDLQRFLLAQDGVFEEAIREIRSGEKRSHWMWFIFPQSDGLGASSMASKYAIKSIEESRAYLAHPVLGERLLKATQAAFDVQGKSAQKVFGSPDALKLRSSMTLFASVSPTGSVFERLLDKYFQGEQDAKTLELLAGERSTGCVNVTPNNSLPETGSVNPRSWLFLLSHCRRTMIGFQSLESSDERTAMTWRWWLLRLGIGFGIIAVSLQIENKEGMWLFAVGVVIVLATVAIGALRSVRQYWRSRSRRTLDNP